MVEILLLIVFIVCFTAPLFFIIICEWLNYKKAKKAEMYTGREDELSLFIGAGFTIFLTMTILTVIGLELCHKVCMTLHSYSIL